MLAGRLEHAVARIPVGLKGDVVEMAMRQAANGGAGVGREMQRIDGQAAAAVERAKWALGYPDERCDDRAERQLGAYLQGSSLPFDYVARLNARAPDTAPTGLTVATLRGEAVVPVSFERGHPALPAPQLALLLPLSLQTGDDWAVVTLGGRPFRFLLGAPLFLDGQRAVPLVAGDDGALA